ncbi:hypothetical protein SAMN05192550_1497 [Flavobacterium glycines]|uniref:Lipoprotein n=1 Tax=Flavobacterium glycines TaxID=551990 RepID=A0A1B9DWM4_9FLAO|nr:hypothetical protein [Flavobacterium glycines]KQB43153.1 hypothetical protein RCH33_677 [Flavobacterium daejeonense]OCB74087.1 hypothetical protein FBGL_02760 [Flavobacterium glycines]GEL09502.1 hypothetical protein FGL01_02410 [Flavobacterium glycines]SDJ04471.1 hypothetical protein SAMN05192550_1497 [Flavobacterium glycines]
MKNILTTILLALILISCGKSKEKLELEAYNNMESLRNEELKLSNDLIDIDTELKKISIKEKHQDIYPDQQEFKYNLNKDKQKIKIRLDSIQSVLGKDALFLNKK